MSEFGIWFLANYRAMQRRQLLRFALIGGAALAFAWFALLLSGYGVLITETRAGGKLGCTYLLRAQTVSLEFHYRQDAVPQHQYNANTYKAACPTWYRP